jgi:hypothetical protein
VKHVTGNLDYTQESVSEVSHIEEIKVIMKKKKGSVALKIL